MSLQIIIEGIEEDRKSGEEVEIIITSGIMGPLEDQLGKLALQEFIFRLRLDGRKPVSVNKITVINDRDWYPEDFPELLKI